MGRSLKGLQFLEKWYHLHKTMGLTSAAQPARGSQMLSGSAGLHWPGPTFDTTVNAQLAKGDNPRVLPTDTSTTAGVGIATKMHQTGNSSSPLPAHLSTYCVYGTCISHGWWELRGMSTQTKLVHRHPEHLHLLWSHKGDPSGCCSKGSMHHLSAWIHSWSRLNSNQLEPT